MAGGAAATQGTLYLAGGGPSTVGAWGLGLLAVVGGVALLAGFLTPITGAAAGLSTLYLAATWDPSPAPSFFIDGFAALLVLADTAALAMLGPGAHSLDAYLFGRREILVVRHDASRH